MSINNLVKYDYRSCFGPSLKKIQTTTVSAHRNAQKPQNTLDVRLINKHKHHRIEHKQEDAQKRNEIIETSATANF